MPEPARSGYTAREKQRHVTEGLRFLPGMHHNQPRRTLPADERPQLEASEASRNARRGPLLPAVRTGVCVVPRDRRLAVSLRDPIAPRTHGTATGDAIDAEP